jgi:hypothetical protein
MPKLISQKNFANINVSGVTTTTSSQFALDNFLKSSFRSAKYQIQVNQGSSYQTTEFLVVHDGTVTYNTEFAIVKTGNVLSTFDSDISGNYVRLLATPSSGATPINFKIIRTTIDS